MTSRIRTPKEGVRKLIAKFRTEILVPARASCGPKFQPEILQLLLRTHSFGVRKSSVSLKVILF